MEKQILSDLGNDFANALDRRDFEGMNVIIDQLAEMGMYEEALWFVRSMCRVRMIDNSKV